MLRIISANRLQDGTVVYLGPSGDWVTQLSEAILFTSDEASEADLAKARGAMTSNLVVDPLIVEITEDGAGRRATTLRNAIRVCGPTVTFKSSAPETVRS